jgi:lipid II isoglutaminyl synthase (glutamine-hydrolysing)
VLRALLRDGRPKHMLLALNDRDDEPDVSWIWDVDFESVCGLVPSAVLSGNRASDLAVRLKYAGWIDADPARITVEPDPVAALRLALAGAPAGQPLWVVGTYQALWQLRDWLRRQGLVSALWEA